MNRIEPLRQLIAEALDELDGVIALREDVFGAAPYLFTNKDDLSELAITPKYPIPTVLKLLQNAHNGSKIGIVCRGCEERGLIEMAKRSQINLDNLKVIGLACTADEAQEWNCYCEKPYPDILADECVGEKIEAVSNPIVDEFQKMNIKEKLDFWQFQFSKCIKCYGCRNACPQCFCPECTLEDELWVEKGAIPPLFPMFHLIRAMHTVGKCVGCRECTLVCPANIPLGTLYTLIRRDVHEMFDYLTGTALDEQPPFVLPMEES